MPQSRHAIRFALTGFGQLARHVHVPVLSRLPGVELVAIAEVDAGGREQARRLAPGARLYENQQEMLAGADFDALVISAPPALHAELAVAAIESGRHVYLEKPAADSLAGAWEILEAWRRARVVGMMGFNYRFTRSVQSARQHLRAGRIGEMRAIRSVFSIAPGGLPEWKKSRRTGGGALLDLASHHIDLIRFLSGEDIREVSARIRSEQTEDDCLALDLTLHSGVSAQSFASLCAAEEDVVEIYGNRGKLTVDRYCLEDVQFTAVAHGRARVQRLTSQMRSFVPGGGFWAKLGAPLHEPSYQIAMQRFSDAIRGLQPTWRRSPTCDDVPDFLDGYRCQEVIDAAEVSSRTCKTVSCAGPVQA